MHCSTANGMRQGALVKCVCVNSFVLFKIIDLYLNRSSYQEQEAKLFNDGLKALKVECESKRSKDFLKLVYSCVAQMFN